MQVNGHEVQRGAPRQARAQLEGFVDGHAELVDLQARRDMGVAFRVDVRIDPDRDARHRTVPRGDGFDTRQLACRLDVDGLQPEWNRLLELGHRFPDAGENNVAEGEAGARGQFQLPDGVGVGGAAQVVDQPGDGEGRVGFQGVMQGVRVVRERAIDGPESLADGAARTHTAASLGRGDFGETHRRRRVLECR